jgi:hypothetical protein
MQHSLGSTLTAISKAWNKQTLRHLASQTHAQCSLLGEASHIRMWMIITAAQHGWCSWPSSANLRPLSLTAHPKSLPATAPLQQRRAAAVVILHEQNG